MDSSQFGEFEKMYLSSGISIEMIDHLIAHIVEYSRPTRKNRYRIARFLLVMKRINDTLQTDFFDNRFTDCAAVLIQPITNSNSYLKVSIRKIIREGLLKLKDVLNDVMLFIPTDATPSPALLSIQQMLKPTCQFFDKCGQVSDDVCADLAAIGVRTIYRSPDEAVINLCGEISDEEFNAKFDKLTFAEPIRPFISFEHQACIGDRKEETDITRTVRTGDFADVALGGLKVKGHGDLYGTIGVGTVACVLQVITDSRKAQALKKLMGV